MGLRWSWTWARAAIGGSALLIGVAAVPGCYGSGLEEDEACDGCALVDCNTNGECACGCSGMSQCRDGEIWGCPSGSCMQPVEKCADAAHCIRDASDGKAFCADSSEDCATLRNLIERGLSPDLAVTGAGEEPAWLSTCSERCGILSGACELGLGACYYVMEGWAADQLSQFLAAYAELGCATPSTCDCGLPPSVTCNPPTGGQMQNHCALN